jgi:hypothetical protein
MYSLCPQKYASQAFFWDWVQTCSEDENGKTEIVDVFTIRLVPHQPVL